MNLHRYKASFSSANTDDFRYEFLGTWIMFAGIFLFAAHIVVEDSVKEVTKLTSLTIGVSYGLYWLSANSRLVLGIFCILSFCVSMCLLQFGTTALTLCEVELAESASVWTNRFRTPEEQFEICSNKALITFYYAVYIFTNFLVSYFYVQKLPRE